DVAINAVREFEIDSHMFLVWIEHPYCIRLLRKVLDDKTFVDVEYSVGVDAKIDVNYYGVSREQEIPGTYKAIGVRRGKIQSRRCDEAALKLCKLVAGLPLFHPVLRDADGRITQIKSILDNPMVTLRRASV